LKQSSLRAIRSQITSIYAQLDAGEVPWDALSTHPEAAGAKLFIDKVIASAAPPKCHEPLDHEIFRKMVEVAVRADKSWVRSKKPADVSLAFAACACILRGTGGRPQEAIKLRFSYIRPNWDYAGRRDGYNIFFPEVDDNGNVISFKGKSDARTRFKVLPERLADGLHIANIIEDYLKIAPRTGPFFQTSMNVKGGGMAWSGKAWDAGVITEKLRKLLRDPRMELDWPEETVKMFSAHSFRATAATSMAAGGADLPLVSTALNHKSTGVTLNHYIHFSKECVRKGLALTGPRGFVRHPARGK
jgi:integrase